MERQEHLTRLVGALALAAGLKAALFVGSVVPFNSDEAVVALMARHIRAGARPAFFYGQSYLGSLDAWLVAAGFALFGQQVWVIRLVQGLLYLGTIASAYLLARKVYPRRAWIARAAVLLLAIPPVAVTLYTTASLGGYGETLLLGNLLLLLALSIYAGNGRWIHWLAFGLLAGLGFWTFGLILVYLLPTGIMLLIYLARRPRAWPLATLALTGAGLSAWPWVSSTLEDGLSSVSELGGSAIAGASAGGYLADTLRHISYFALFGPTVILGLRPSWSVEWLADPLAPVVLAMGAAATWFATRRVTGKDCAAPGRRLLIGVAVTTLAGFLLTPFGADPSGRYFLPVAVPGAILTAEMLYHLPSRRLASVLLLSLAAFNLAASAGSALRYPPGLTTQFDAVAQVDKRYDQALIAFLQQEDETRGYANYWVEFPIAFLSSERLIFSARLPYHLDFRYTSRDDRYGPYRQAVEISPRAAYITSRHPQLDDRLRRSFDSLGVTYAEKQIGDYHVFYRLSRRIAPEELGLSQPVP